MCGFLGIGGKKYKEQKHNLIFSSFEWLKHRGPDQSKFFNLEKFFIGFHRLSIVGVDNKKANQPYYSKDKNFYLMFNGEIFNFKELANQWLNKFNFEKEILESDTLVLAKLIEIYGLRCLEWLDGMFSIAIVFEELGKVQLIRDRYGIKPLYYCIQNNNIIFGSHIKPIIDIHESIAPNSDAILTYLYTGLYDHSNNTFFKDIYSVNPGSIIEFDLETKRIRNENWYDIKEFTNIRNRESYNSLLEEIDETISRVILDYLPDEVECCINASGGVDSSLLINEIFSFKKNILVQNQDYKIPYSEKKWIEEYSKKLNIKPIYHLIEPDFILEDLKSTFIYQGQPFGGVTVPGYTPLYINANKQNCKVIFDGTGLDEAFLGYPRYASKNFTNNFWKNSIIGSSGPTDHRGIRPNAINTNLLKKGNLINSSIDELDGVDHARLMSMNDIAHYKIPRTTRFTDHSSSRFSLELRSPFLSHKIIHLGMSIESNLLISDKGTKLPIRDLLAKKGLPMVAYAPKRYVQSPQNEWLAKEFRDMLKNYIFSDSFYSRGWIKPEVIKEEYNLYLNSSKENSFYIWQWMSLEIWARTFLDN
ncbi:asparagine synthetase B family protein [Prochlorococcus marinus]|uniref:asparagine synthetase B family protein n=1 Tax=Prochlorococcus marinus TaxID=1219 RepID=UPI001ADC5763|nr:asparagine synthetase B [Prochlorococcus marinus]MBO8217698.1 asparagine synthetase B [Prochlorococcus marinus XMU1405]MBW3040861.1 hypothetical protein [Prochlorococcus marinus str. MU1405]MBW3048321.1 hypothetical protein [Prochlorococcus marinus str. MU1406]